MRLVFTILLIGLVNANATVYYVSNTGSDAADGLTTGTPWQTISKVNASSFLPGDQILFKKGDSWNEKLTISSSGSIGNVITFGSYDTGEKPLITGFQTLAMSDQGSNIWGGTATNSVRTQNTVKINGQIRAKARYPNSTYLVGTGFPTKSQFVVPHSDTNYAGYGIVLRCATWVQDQDKIVSVNDGAANDTFNLLVPASYNNLSRYYFFQNHPSLLDTLNEYTFDSTTNQLSVYAESSPTVYYSSLDTLVAIHQKSYITIDGLRFSGANKIAIQADSLRGLTIINCSIDDSFYGTHIDYTNGVSVLNDTLLNILSNGVFAYRDTSIRFENNYFKNIAQLDGMCANGNSTSTCFYNDGTSYRYYNNRMDSIGYIGINFKGANGLVQYNLVSNYCGSKQDGAAFYTWQGLLNPETYNAGTVVRDNIAVNGIGNYLNHEVVAYYLDDQTYGVTYKNNTAYNFDQNAFLIKGSHNTIDSNTVYDTKALISVYSFPEYTSGTMYLTIKNNIFYTNGSTTNHHILLMRGVRDTTENIDSNYYLMPAAPQYTFNRGGGSTGGRYNLARWQAYTGYDLNSSSTIPAASISNTPVLFYNATLTDSTVLISRAYVDVKGTIYLNAIRIKPFCSKLLFPATIATKTRLKSLIFQ